MAKGQVRLLFSLVGQDKLSSAIEKSRNSVDRFADTSTKAGKKSGGAFGKLTGTISGIPGRLSDLNAGFQLVGQAINMASQAIDELAEAEKRVNASRIFQQTQAGTKDAEAAMDELAKATRGALNQEQLIAFSNSMRFAGQDLDTITKTLETAFLVSQGTGREMLQVAETLRDSLITGAGTGFEFLGITRDLNKEIEAQAVAMGKNTDSMDTAQKAEFRLEIISKTLQDRLLEMNIDVGQLSTTFQGFKTDLDNAKNSASNFAAASMGGTQKENEVKGMQMAIGRLFNEFETQLNKNDPTDFIEGVARVTGVSRDLVRDGVEDLLKQGLVTEGRVDIFVKNLLKIRDEGRDKEANARREALKQKRKDERAADLQRINDIEFNTEQLGLLEEDKNKAIAENNKALIEEIDTQINRISLKLQFLRGEVDVAEFTAQMRRGDALAAQKEMVEFEKEATAMIKGRAQEKKEAAARAKEAKKERELEAAQMRKNLEEIQTIRNQRRIEELKAEKKFFEAQQIAEREAQRRIIGDESKFEAMRIDQRVLAEEKLDSELKKIREQFRQETEAFKVEQENKDREENQRKEEEEKRHLDSIAEFRRKHREQDIRQAEEFAAYASSLSGDLRRYDEDTATVIQGQAEITQALAQNAGNAAKQASAGIAAGGRMTESLIKNDKAAAATRAAFETAAGFASLAGGDVIGSTMHFTAAGLFAALAGGAGGKKGGARRGGTTQISRGGGGSVVGMGDASTGNQVVVNVAGFVTGTTKDLGVQVANTMNDVQSTGLSTASV